MALDEIAGTEPTCSASCAKWKAVARRRSQLVDPSTKVGISGGAARADGGDARRGQRAPHRVWAADAPGHGGGRHHHRGTQFDQERSPVPTPCVSRSRIMMLRCRCARPTCSPRRRSDASSVPWCSCCMSAYAISTAVTRATGSPAWFPRPARCSRWPLTCRSCQVTRIDSTSGKYSYSVARPLPASLAICDIVMDASPCSATGAAVVLMVASRTERRCTLIVSITSWPVDRNLPTRRTHEVPCKIGRAHV